MLFTSCCVFILFPMEYNKQKLLAPQGNNRLSSLFTNLESWRNVIEERESNEGFRESGKRSLYIIKINNVFSGWHFDLLPDMKGNIFYIVPKNPHHAQQGNWVRWPFLIGSWDWRQWGTDDETNSPLMTVRLGLQNVCFLICDRFLSQNYQSYLIFNRSNPTK
jgi:hypothetical protein